ncbi:hypothetical protein ZEAMMB73_Zm00001d006206 [Zea mays]|uniref:Uncharacterized protein n=1 Tax=Zea mays TaxID=4577 RepID=A0A1D6ETQ6_MAIZE|nr:hypothetical protein ZEAMMB73_Zm00001d006206 [Zea mays]
MVGKGDVSPDGLYAIINKRVEKVFIRMEVGSYRRRILVEYLKEIQARSLEQGKLSKCFKDQRYKVLHVFPARA